MTSVISRLAPSPTGAQHVGNVRTYLLAWLSARSRGGSVILRIEDIDSPRVKPWATQQAIDDLRWLGLDWDAGPDVVAPRGKQSIPFEGPFVQTERLPRYQEVLNDLRRRELVYPCTCTRSDIEAAASAPHAGQEGPRYPGTCAGRSAVDAENLPASGFAWRFRMPSTPEAVETLPTSGFTDLLAGEQVGDLVSSYGDFVVAKGKGTSAYQLAVVVDDHDMGITEVVRGNDLIFSTHRQLALYTALGWSAPQFAHVPLVIGLDGRRLAKRHGDTRISILRELGVPPEKLVGYLAWTCGLQETPRPIAARELIERFDWSLVPRAPLTFATSAWDSLIAPA